MNPDDDREEVERRSELAKFVPCLVSLITGELTLYGRSLEEIGKRSLALSEKGKVARVLDKSQDAQEVINLVEKLRQAILVYQVGARDLQSWDPLTRGAGVTTTVDLQPGRPLDCEFFSSQSSIPRLSAIRGILRCSFEVASGKRADTRPKTLSDTFAEVAGYKQDRVCPCTVGSNRKGSGCRQGCR